MATNPNIEELKLPELKQMGESLGIKKVRSMRKPELVSAIKSFAKRTIINYLIQKSLLQIKYLQKNMKSKKQGKLMI